MKRDFTARTINQKWCTDITYIHVLKEGWTYLASVMDLCSRKIIGYAYGTSMTTELSFAKSEMPAEFREHYRDYRDCELGTPDAVYICDSYDDRNPCFSIPPEFYAARLQEVTDVIAYVAPYEVGDFSDELSPDMTVLRYYVDEPAVIRADWVFVPTECMKSHYIDELSRFAGEQTCEYWQNIVATYEPEREEISKSLLFCVGLSRFTERDESFEKTLARRLTYHHF